MQKKLKIFVDAHCFDGPYQGSRTFIKGLYSALSLCSDVSLYFGAYNIENIRKEFPDLPLQQFIRYKHRSSFMRIAFDLPRILRTHEFDYAHFQYVAPVVKYCKYIVTMHDVLFEDFREEFSFLYRLSRTAFFRYSFRQADVRTAPSAYSGSRLSFHYKLLPAEIQIVPNGVNDLFFHSLLDKKKSACAIREKYGVENFILYVSRIEPRKNHNRLLQCYLDLELYGQDIPLVFVGEMSLSYPVLMKQMDNLPPAIRKYVRHFRAVPQEDLAHFYRAARLFVYPSKAEGFGIPPLEAAASGTPVLCANTTAMADYTFFSENLFDPFDENELREKLAYAISRDVDEQMLQSISGVIRENYSWQKSAAELLRRLW